jgi:hypothetical protein
MLPSLLFVSDKVPARVMPAVLDVLVPTVNTPVVAVRLLSEVVVPTLPLKVKAPVPLDTVSDCVAAVVPLTVELKLTVPLLVSVSVGLVCKTTAPV